MSPKPRWMAAAIAAAIVVAGCKSADDELAPAVVPKTFTFEGKVEQKYVGVWGSLDGVSTLSLQKDGKLQIETATRSVAGKSVSHVAGQWLATGDTLMLQYSSGSQQPTVLKYAATFSGDSLTLLPEGSRIKNVYKRK